MERDQKAIDCLMIAGWIDGAKRTNDFVSIHWTSKGIARLQQLDPILKELDAFGQLTPDRQIGYLIIQTAILQGIDNNGCTVLGQETPKSNPDTLNE